MSELPVTQEEIIDKAEALVIEIAECDGTHEAVETVWESSEDLTTALYRWWIRAGGTRGDYKGHG